MRRVSLLLVSFLLTLALVEAGLRLAGVVEYRPLPPPETEEIRGKGRLLYQASSTDGLDYELVPSQTRRWRRWTIETNSAGMRDREPLPEGPGVVRIAAIGDSFTFGWGVHSHQAYPNVVEQLLNEDAPAGVEYDVLNFGVSGYSTRDEAVVMENKVARWEPSLITLGYVLNDIETEPVQPLPNAFARPHWWQHSHLLRLMAQGRLEWGIRTRGDGDYYRYLYADEAHWRALDESFARIERAADRIGAPVLMVIFPRIPGPAETWDGYLYEGTHERVKELGLAHGFFVHNLYPRFRRVRPARFGVTDDDRHPNGLGHYLAARAIEYRLQHQLSDRL
jgi:lysophospholipase L1-like esterase